jgi:hypothetical protein
MDSDVVALVLAAFATAAGAVLAADMWRRHRRSRRVLRSRHPSARPPIQVGHAAGSSQILVTVPLGAPEISIDIVSFRRRASQGPWEAAQLDEPVVVAPGGEARFGVGVDPETDVVVAWTVGRDAAAVQGSRLFRLPPERDELDPTPRSAAGLTGLVTAVLFALLVVSGVLIGRSFLDGDADDGSAAPTASSPPIAPAPVATSPSTAPSAVSTTVAEPTEPATSVPAASTTTTSSTTSSSSTNTTTTADAAGDGASVDAFGRIEPCRFGEQCLVVGFTITGFDGSPAEYVCEFDDGSRFTFGFVGDGAETACATGTPTATIIVEVAGVRSDPITRP